MVKKHHKNMPVNNQSNGSSTLEIAQSNQDLILIKGKRKKRTWIISGIICAIVIALIVMAIILLIKGNDHTKKGPDPSPEADALSLEDILYGKVNPNSFNATWVSGTELIYTDDKGNLVMRNVDLGANTTTVLIVGTEPILSGAFEFELSADRKYLRIAHTFQKIYRHSYRARYTIIDLNTKEHIQLALGNIFDFRLAVWAPIGNGLAFVDDNNIYYKGDIKSQDIIQITKDNGFILNGIPDWVYEEEIFSSNKALWFSLDGKKLAYGRFDDRNVPFMSLPIYGEPGNPIFQYPRAQLFRYPKAGTPNPTVSLHYVDLDNATLVKKLEPPSDLINRQPILTAVAWATNNVVSAIWMNRVQNSASIVTYLAEEPYSTEIIKRFKEESGWLELFTPPIFSNDGSTLLIILSQDQGSLGSYRHVVMLSREQNSQITPLTKGAFVVTSILGWNFDNNQIYYLATAENDSAHQHLYSVSYDNQTTQCLSCGVRSADNTNCLYNTATFSKDSTHYILNCAGPGVPSTVIYSINQKVMDWETNENLQRLVRAKIIPNYLRMNFEVDGGFKAQVQLRLPSNFDPTGNTKYPMLVNVYAGPDSFQVTEKFNLDWGSYLAANKSIIYATIDGRGSGLKGDKMMFASYRHLGTVEIVDQINVTKQIQETLPYVDESRTAIWGWSYGGYAAGMILANDKQGIFKCGISVAPVTDWTLYDSIYTERFMGMPTIEDNFQGYRDANLLTQYEGLRDKLYFLIHGTYDDNVHYQQSMLWAKVLEQNDILFRQLSYPDEDHGLASVRPHLYHSLEDFLDECFITKGG